LASTLAGAAPPPLLHRRHEPPTSTSHARIHVFTTSSARHRSRSAHQCHA
jgi:hypothetical protein